MNRQKKNANGITLIALVISIIVMLILAGVSLNLTIGDNGIINQAQKATILNGCAVLEEFLQQTYIKEGLTENNAYDVSSSEMSKLDTMIRNHPNWFFMNGTHDYVLTEFSHTAEDGTEKTDYLKIRLINKEGLRSDNPELVKQLNAGNTKTNDDYLNFLDVYGVTSDLKVFYCADGISTAIGADYSKSDFVDGSKTLYSSTTGLSKIVSETFGTMPEDLSMSDLYGITELKITNSSGVTDLKFLFDVPNLKKITFEKYSGSLIGIENATKLDYIYFDNGAGMQNIDYTNLRYATTITQLYFKMPTDIEVDKLMTEMSNADYKNLATIGLYGYNRFDFEYEGAHKTNIDSDNRASFSNLGYLNRLTKETKHAVVKMYLNNNSISTINLNFSSENGFNKIRHLYLHYNYIASSSGLENATTLAVLGLRRNPLAEVNNIPISNLLYLDISTTEVESLYPLAEGKLTWLDGYDLNNLDFNDAKWSANEKDKLNKIGKIQILIIPSEYTLCFSNKKVVYVPEDYTSTQFSNAISNNQYIESLSIKNNKNISSDTINTVIATLSNLKYLDADNTNLETISGLSNNRNMLGIRITRTEVTDLKPLKKSAEALLRFIIIDNDETVMDSETIKMLDKVMKRKYTVWGHEFFGSRGGLCCSSTAVLKKFEGSTDLTHYYSNGVGVDETFTLDLTGCTNLEYVYARYAENLKIKVPVNCKVELHDTGFRLILPQNGTISYLKQYVQNYDNVNTNGGNINKVEIQMRGIGGSTSAWLSSINPTIFELYGSEGETKVSTTYGFLGNYTNLTTFRWRKTKITDVTIVKTIKSTANLVTLDLNYNNIRDLSQFYDIYTDNTQNGKTNLSQVTTLSLQENMLSTIDGLLPEVFPALSSLELNNNNLENVITVTKSNGEKANMKICDYLATFPNLTYINLTGNMQITDFSGLINAGYTKNNLEFTRTLSN